MVIMLSIVLLLPKMLPLIFEQPQTVLPVYDLGDSRLVAELKNVPGISVQKLHSEQELQTALCSALYPEIGLLLLADFNQVIAAGEQVELQGYMCWGQRYQASELQPKLEEMLSKSLGQLVTIQIEGNLVYPPRDLSL